MMRGEGENYGSRRKERGEKGRVFGEKERGWWEIAGRRGGQGI